MLMTGRFFSIQNEENKKEQEPLFIARCEQILSSIPNIPTNSFGATNTKTLRFVLTDQLNIREISSKLVFIIMSFLHEQLLLFSTESLLGYKADELMDQSINRILASEHISVLEHARKNCSKTLSNL